MRSFDISEDIFVLVDRILETTVPSYIEQLKGYNITLSYMYVDSAVGKSMSISMIDRAIWFMDLDDLIIKAFEDDILNEKDVEDFRLQHHLGLSLTLD